MNNCDNNEHWGSRLGVVLAVSGSAVGLGNFLRFPAQAATSGGGAFMIPYLVALFIVAIPVACAEWALGRYGGTRGRHSPMGIYYEASGRNRFCGVCGGMVCFTAFVIDMYYLFVEAWCLLYALQYLGGLLKPLGLGFSLFPRLDAGFLLQDADAYRNAFDSAIGLNGNGSLFNARNCPVIFILLFCCLCNFWLIYRGVSKGIERFCKLAAPLILICSLIILVRVFTLENPTGRPGQSLLDGLGFMWNPQNLREVLRDPDVWLKATSQIFFSTSICTSAVITYASYVRPKQDVALSSLTSVMANEFCEVCLGGLMIVPPAIMYLGAAAEDKIGSIFSLGFVVLPNVFGEMPAGQFFGFTFFTLLFFSAITSSISQLQPSVTFLSESFGWARRRCVWVSAAVIICGAFFVGWFTENLTALDTFDFWSANFSPFLCALVQTSVVVFIMGRRKLSSEIDRGAVVKTSKFITPLLTFVSLPYLALVFGFWLCQNFKGRVDSLIENRVAQLSSIFLIVVAGVLLTISCFVVARWKREEKRNANDATIISSESK